MGGLLQSNRVCPWRQHIVASSLLSSSRRNDCVTVVWTALPVPEEARSRAPGDDRMWPGRHLPHPFTCHYVTVATFQNCASKADAQALGGPSEDGVGDVCWAPTRHRRPGHHASCSGSCTPGNEDAPDTPDVPLGPRGHLSGLLSRRRGTPSGRGRRRAAPCRCRRT